jgi:AraC family transcriptional regulator
MQEQQLCALSVPQGLVEVRRYAWTKPEFLTFHRNDYMLSRVVSRTGGSSQQIGWRLPCAGKAVSALQMSVVAPESPVELAFDPGEALVISCILDPGYFEDATGISRWSERHSLACLGLKSPVIDLIFERLAYEARAARGRPDRAVETWIDALASELSRRIERSLGGQAQGQLAPWQLERIFSLVRDPCTERRLTIKEIAYACEVSSRHLMRAFRATTGLTLHQFLNEARMQRAMSLLRSSNIPVKTVARQLGFSTPSAFSAAFLQSTAVTPSDYRARFRTG